MRIPIWVCLNLNAAVDNKSSFPATGDNGPLRGLGRSLLPPDKKRLELQRQPRLEKSNITSLKPLLPPVLKEVTLRLLVSFTDSVHLMAGIL